MPTTTITPRGNARSESSDLSPEELLALPLGEYIAYMKNRTPEQIAAMQERLHAGTPVPYPLPEGKTLEDVIVGQIDFGVSDAEIARVLDDLS